MQTKRLLSLLTAAAICLGLLAGCGGTAGGGKTTGAPSAEAPSIEESATELPTDAATEPVTEVPPAEPYAPGDDSIFFDLPLGDQEDFIDAWDMGEGSEMLIYRADSEDSFLAYQDALAAQSYSLYAENEIAGNLYATWTGGPKTVTLMYTPSQEQLRITAEPSGPLPALDEDNVWTKVCDPLINMLGVDYTQTKENGMCFLYRLSDGSFIVVDGGFNDETCADALYGALRELAPDPDNIVIAAWFISHAHSDHIGGFYAFSAKYSEDVTVEEFVINFPTAQVFEDSDVSVNHLTRFRDCAAQYEGARVIEAHPGQIYYLRDAVIEILYTWDLYPQDLMLNFFNNTSLVFTVELGGEKLMQLGDCGPFASRVIVPIYGEYLKSDIIQVGHHGQIGPTAELNALIAPEIVLWPASDVGYKRFSNFSNAGDGRNVIFEDMEYVYAAGPAGRVTTLTLPFSPEGVSVWTSIATEED